MNLGTIQIQSAKYDRCEIIYPDRTIELTGYNNIGKVFSGDLVKVEDNGKVNPHADHPRWAKW